jgi:hypothetical protein
MTTQETSPSSIAIEQSARALKVGTLLWPAGDVIAKVLQSIGVPVGDWLKPSDRATIERFYASRKKLSWIMGDGDLIKATPAANDATFEDTPKTGTDG